MNLLELAEPIFQYVCRLNRLARKSGGGNTGETSFIAKTPGQTPTMPKVASLDYAVVRSEVKAMFEDFLARSNSDMRLNVQARKVELALVFFVDSMISDSALPFAAQWNQNRLAYERNELAGDEKFFDLLEETMKDSSEDASERLAVFYNCVGLGFSGIYFRQPEYLRKTMLTIAPRIRHLVEADQTAKICPDAYEGIDSRDLVQPPGSKMVFVGILFLCFILAVLITYVFLYRSASSSLSTSLDQILSQEMTVKK
ncbi:MAG: DotU family type IV/VI secretion system protein [Tepidisphaeraceae bacterium]